MSVIGPRCHELRIPDEDTSWRIVYCLDPDAVVILDVFETRCLEKGTRSTPFHVIHVCRLRLKRHEEES